MRRVWFTPRGGPRGGSQVVNEHAFDLDDYEERAQAERAGPSTGVTAVCGKVMSWFYTSHSTPKPVTSRRCAKCVEITGEQPGTPHGR